MALLRPSKALILILLVCTASVPVQAQDAVGHTFQAVVKSHDGEVLRGVNVSVEGTLIGAATNLEGRVEIVGIADGDQTILFSYVGFESARLSLNFPLENPERVHEVEMEEAHGELEEISVSATRTSRTIADQATRVETIAGEEIDEKISMEPANISMLLNESPGITVQQTSAVSGGASIRIQGLDGRYTQILKDGFPLYGGFSGGLSLLQVPPLDLQQVEIIKGPSSTLYGGDAIAGLVNLVSKGPSSEPELSLLTNATTAGGFDLGGFYTARGNRFGVTVLGSANTQKAYDPDDDDFSNLPDTRRVTLNPKLFYYPSERTTLSFGLSGTFEIREGGDLEALEGGTSSTRSFIETNTSSRISSQTRLDRDLDTWLGGEAALTLKNSVSLFDRTIEVPDYRFDGTQVASYSEASLLVTGDSHQLSAGLDSRTDEFREDGNENAMSRDYSYRSFGAFAQDTWDATDKVVVEAGLRVENHNEFGSFVLPKASALFRARSNLSIRVGAGLGYKAPTVFLEPSESRAFRGVIPLSGNVDAETSQGGSVDLNYRTLLGERVVLSINQAFYFTDLSNPLIPVFEQGVDPISTELRYENLEGDVRTRAHETNAKISLGDVKLFLGYVYLDAETDSEDGPVSLELTPKHKTYTVLVYEKHGLGRIGFEAYRTGEQTLTNGTRTDAFWILGLMAERKFGRARLFLNFENFLDTKQSNYSPIVLGGPQNPRFADIWAPMDGFIVNGGVKYTL